jgi:hypothetical protein
MHSIKIHRSYRNVIAIADLDLIGKRFEEGIKQLDVRESFYKDKEISKEDLIKLMQRQQKEDASFNIVGEKSVQAALEAGIINEDAIGKVNNVPFALTLL